MRVVSEHDCHDRPSSGSGICSLLVTKCWRVVIDYLHHKLNAPSNHVNAASNAGLPSPLVVVRAWWLLHPRRPHARQGAMTNSQAQGSFYVSPSNSKVEEKKRKAPICNGTRRHPGQASLGAVGSYAIRLSLMATASP